jgi:hypothetical protein
MKRSLVIVVLAIGLSLGVASGVLTGSRWQHAARGNGSDIVSDAGSAHPIYDLDPTDDRELADYATDIFIGRVLGQTGAVGAPTSAPGHAVPQSQFTVEILHLLKGKAGGVVTVNQIGGLDTQAGATMLMEGDELLRPGASELFLVVFVHERGWYQIAAAGYGHLPADDPTQREALIDRFAQAIAPSEGDTASRARPEVEKT